jgi:hypothetical protein
VPECAVAARGIVAKAAGADSSLATAMVSAVITRIAISNGVAGGDADSATETNPSAHKSVSL